MLEQPAIVVITGLMASGKSTVAQALAQRLPSAAHVRGDGFRQMIVSGRAELLPPLTPTAQAQLHLRYRLAALGPHPSVIEDRERARDKIGYSDWSISEFDDLLRHGTPRQGLWVDNSDIGIEETVDAILLNLPAADVSDWVVR